MSKTPRSLQLYLLYVFLGGFLAAEPASLKLFCQTYLPGFYYRWFTVPIAGILGIAALVQWRVYRGYSSIEAATILRQLSSRSFTQNCVAGISAIRRTVLSIYQSYADFGLQLWTGGQIRYQFWWQSLADAVNWMLMRLGLIHQPPQNYRFYKIATEPMARVWSNKAYKYFLLAEFSLLIVVICICFSFWRDVLRWGWFDTSLIVVWRVSLLFFCIYICDSISIKALKSQQLAKQSGQDLLEIAEILEAQKTTASDDNQIETEGWRFEYRVILSQTQNFSQWKKYSLKSLISLLANLRAKQRDIDILAISPDGYYFIIELKSHVGEVLWNPEKNTIYRRVGTASKPIPFKRDLLDQVKGQARRLKAQRKLSRLPERILVFWRAKVCIRANKRVKRGVLISDKSRLIRDLHKRNRQLVEQAQER